MPVFFGLMVVGLMAWGAYALVTAFSTYLSESTAHRRALEAERLATVTISKADFRKGGFDDMMIMTFTLRNANDFDVKDIEIDCSHSGNSGTVIDSNVRTVYEIVKAKGSKTIRDFNMGFIHS